MKTNLHPCPPVGPKSLLPDLSPLEEFYAGRGIAVPPVWGVAPEDIPQPGRRLLVHESDMTSTLENFYGDKLRVHVLGHRAAGNEYFREVALTLERDGRPVEFGAIKISLDLFPAEARREILREKQPLGRILALFGMNFASRPAGYLRVLSDDVIGQALGLDGPQSLYGRRNTLWDAWDRPLAEIVEILSPT